MGRATEDAALLDELAPVDAEEQPVNEMADDPTNTAIAEVAEKPRNSRRVMLMVNPLCSDVPDTLSRNILARANGGLNSPKGYLPA